METKGEKMGKVYRFCRLCMMQFVTQEKPCRHTLFCN